MTKCIRSAWRACATGRWRTNGSVSASARGFGPVDDVKKLQTTFAEAIAAVEAGGVAVVDVRVEPGYTPAMTAAVSNAERKA